MSVWDSIVGQQQVVEQLRAISSGNARDIAQSWLICGPEGSGREQVARAFAAALESPDHGLDEQPTRVTQQIMADTYPDVLTVSTEKVMISIDEVRDVISKAEQMPATAPWRIIIMEHVDRMSERTTNVLLKEIEEPSAHTIWLLCAPSANDVLPTIRSRTRIVTLGVPSDTQVARSLEERGVERALAVRAARLAQGNLELARLYAQPPASAESGHHGKQSAKQHQEITPLQARDQLVGGVLELARASQAVLLADWLVTNAQQQAEAEVAAKVERAQTEFLRANGLAPTDKVPPALRRAYQAISKKDEVKRQSTRKSRDVLDRALTSVASVYRDVAVVQNDATEAVGIVNVEYREAIVELSGRLRREQVVQSSEAINVARRRLHGNGNVQLVFEALFCALIPVR